MHAAGLSGGKKQAGPRCFGRGALIRPSRMLGSAGRGRRAIVDQAMAKTGSWPHGRAKEIGTSWWFDRTHDVALMDHTDAPRLRARPRRRLYSTGGKDIGKTS